MEFGYDPRKTTETQRALKKLLENRQWFDKNIHELQEQYRGKVIAVHDGKVICHGSTSEEVDRAIEGKYPEEEVLKIMVPTEDIIMVPYPG